MESEERRKYELEAGYKNKFVKIDNSVIRSREKTNLLESKIEILAIHRLANNAQQRTKIDVNGNTYKVNYVTVNTKEIQLLTGRNDGDMYEDIRHAAFALKEKFLLIENKDDKQFSLKSMYGDVAYNNGTLYIEFNPDVNDLFLDLKNRFTKLSLKIMFTFKRNGGFQLYKLLKSYSHELPQFAKKDLTMDQADFPTIKISFTLTDLRMIMGYVDIEQDKLKEEASRKNPNFEKMVNMEKKPKYRRWSDFNERVIKPGVKEINNISDIYIKEVDKIGVGKGGKISSIDFYIQHNKRYYEENGIKEGVSGDNENADNKKGLSEEFKNDFYDEVIDIIEERVKIKEIITISEASGYDIEKVKKAYKSLKEYSTRHDVDNITGFILKAIQDNYEPSCGRKKSNRKEQGMMTHDYDFKAIEEMLLK